MWLDSSINLSSYAFSYIYIFTLSRLLIQKANRIMTDKNARRSDYCYISKKSYQTKISKTNSKPNFSQRECNTQYMLMITNKSNKGFQAKQMVTDL